ncbi:hypothetical protein [Bartonella ancashensis]|uniref:Putative phage protein n=1 Tax=Bartonella ancashensis TaxID=1318743 RepID=A0A0M4LFM2_9HYPH|nr:hypothetical protein [Bartonella ancashensis]ALE03057.1 putative phage protein [Bartonella ancashensis]
MDKEVRPKHKICHYYVYCKKIYRKIFFVVVASFLCLFFVYCFFMKKGPHFFSTEEVVQQEQIPLDIPTFDFPVYCKEVAASVVPDMRYEVYQRCFYLEGEAYFVIRAMWDKISEESKKKCIKMIRPGDGNYFLLQDCLINAKSGNRSTNRNYF